MTHGKPCVNMLGVWNVITWGGGGGGGVQTSGEPNIEKRKERKKRNRKMKEREERKKRNEIKKKGKEEGNRNQSRAGSRTRRKRTRNCDTRGRFPPTPVILC